MKKSSVHLLVLVTATVAFAAVGCRRPIEFSTVLEGGFDPVVVFRQHGYHVENETRGASIRNHVTGYGWQSWCGVLTAEGKPVECEAIAVLVRDDLNRALGNRALDELTGLGARSGQPGLTGMLRYNKGGAHGDMHVWLITRPSETSVSYVIFVREERLE